ncbi:MAG: hypothetical protein JXR78_12510 [Victivallales bacterium]|nr:hypothetical protein [Victivallales bacterium]
MIINADEIIAQQLNATGTSTMQFAGGHHTQITQATVSAVPEDSRITLDGEWHVKYYPFEENEAAALTGFENWQRKTQPGKICYADPEAESLDIPNWDRVGLKHIDDNDGAIIVRKITVPENWSGMKIILRFEAIYPAGIIYVNGKKVAEQYSGLTPLEADVSSLAQPGGEAIISVRLLRKHRFIKMDMPRHSLEFAGLAQSACLFAVPAVHVRDYHLISELTPDFKKGQLKGTVNIAGDAPARLCVKLTKDGKTVASCACEVAAGQQECTVNMTVENPELWNDEYPNLYNVSLSLESTDGTCKYGYRTGFRRLELSPEGAKLNGTFVKFRGVNHLSFHPQGGLFTPSDWLRSNLELMKKANVNAIRTHFTGPSELCDLCDEMGIYLLQEIPIDWGTNYIHDPEWTGPAMHRIESVIKRDRHHPSLMVWSVGNENMPESAAVAADGWNHLRIYDQFCHLLDPSRPTMFPPPGPANKIEGIFELRVGDIADTHYSFNHARKFLQEGRIANPDSWEANHTEMTSEEALERGWSGCWFSSEWGIANMIPDLLNSPYANIIDDFQEDIFSGRNSLQVCQDRLEREWGLMRSEKSCLGGAYFPWISCSAGDVPWGWMRFGEDADWGVVCGDLTVKPYFWALRKAFSPVHFPSRLIWRKGQNDINFEVQNQFNAIDLKDCTFRLQFNRAGKWMTMIRKFTDVKVSCPPGDKTIVRLPLTDDSLRTHLDDNGALMFRITLLDPKGFKVTVAETLVLPEGQARPGDQTMPIGPDAIL